MLKDNRYMVIEAKFNLIKDDKFVIQKSMADQSLYQKYKENNLVGYKVGDAMVYPIILPL